MIGDQLWKHSCCKIKKITTEEIRICCYVINPRWSWLGCSPDKITKKMKQIEVKCQFTHRDSTTEKTCMESKKILMYLEKKNQN